MIIPIHLTEPKYFALNCKYLTPSMTYEHYLIEILNGSLGFFTQKRTRFEQFKLVEKQDCGEPDAVSSLYSIDFKLLVDQEIMAALNKNRPNIDLSHKKDGLIIFNERQDKVPVPEGNILLDLMELKEGDIKSGQLSETIRNLLENMTKDKNLFFYYPYEFSSPDDYQGRMFEGVLNRALRVIMDFRTEAQPHKDTFICIKANKWFLIYEWTDKGFLFRDKVNEAQCMNYMDAKSYSIY